MSDIFPLEYCEHCKRNTQRRHNAPNCHWCNMPFGTTLPTIEDGEYQGDSLEDFVSWAQLILEKNPNAKVWTYETTNVSADYREEEKAVVISGLL